MIPGTTTFNPQQLKSTKMVESRNIKNTILPIYNYPDLTSNTATWKCKNLFFFIKLVTKRYFKVNANWQIKNPTSFSSGYSLSTVFSDLRGSSQRATAHVCAGVCERVHGYPTFPSLPGTLQYLHSAAFSSGEHRSGPPSRLCPRCPVVWGQAASLSYLRDPHASQDKASLIPWCCGSVMLIQLPTGRETQLVCLVDLFQMYCMLYLPVVINKHRWNSSQQKWKIILLLTNSHYFL